MSRHSKNCTAHSIFTHGEKSKLSEKWGAVKERIGTDSQKRFEECSLCLSVARDPTTCSSGHMFCKECVFENLVEQRRQAKTRLNQIEKNHNEQQIAKVQQEQEDAVAKIEAFETKQGLSGLQATGLTREEQELSMLTEEERVRKECLDKFKETKFGEMRQVVKKEWIKSSFWMPENTTTADDNLPTLKEQQEASKSGKLMCPIGGDHTHPIKVKDLVTLKLQEEIIIDKQGNKVIKFCCQLCMKHLNSQKIVALKGCGHVFCKKCATNFMEKDKSMRCTECNKTIKSTKEIINMKESGTSFAAHSQVEATIQKPAFQS